MGALLAAVQGGPAFGAGTAEHSARRQCGGTAVTTRRRNRLHQTRKARPGDVDRGARTGRLRLRAAVVAVKWRRSVVITVLTVLTIGVQGAQISGFSLAPGADGESWRSVSKFGCSKLAFGIACGNQLKRYDWRLGSRGRYTSLLPRNVPAVQLSFINNW
jgi:hypothetical protein